MKRRIMVPTSLAWLQAERDGRRWLESVPDLVDRCVRRWNLELGSPYDDSHVSLVLPARTVDRPAVLKLQFPDRESEYEADALLTWNGDGAVLLLDGEPAWGALLLERCTPGTYLSSLGPPAALETLESLLARLQIPAGAPFRALADEAADWAAGMVGRWERAGRPFEADLVNAALEALHDLAHTQGEQVLIHQDLHPGNVLAAEREPWLVIDPKPIVGEREFGLAPIIRSAELGHSRADVVHRLDSLTESLGLDRERTRLWALGQTLAWAYAGDRAIPGHVDIARWLRDA